MGGILFIKFIGACVRFLIKGFSVSVKELMNDEDEEASKLFSKNFIVGFIVSFTILIIVVIL